MNDCRSWFTQYNHFKIINLLFINFSCIVFIRILKCITAYEFNPFDHPGIEPGTSGVITGALPTEPTATCEFYSYFYTHNNNNI